MIALLAASVLLQADNTLTPAETQAGWKLLFDGKSTKGWHTYLGGGAVKSGWKVENGVLSIVDAGTAGDIATDEKFDWFELSVDVNISKGQNSGIMFRVADGSLAPWHSGPEVQIYDHPFEKGVETTGFLYQLYTAEKDAAKPSGEWNRIRIVLAPAPEKSFTEVNGTRYYDFVYQSEDFWARVKKSKFSKFAEFAKADKGSIAVQGDHGSVSFKNIKIRPIKK